MLKIHWNNNCEEHISNLQIRIAEKNALIDNLKYELKPIHDLEAKYSVAVANKREREDRITQLLQEIETLKEQVNNERQRKLDTSNANMRSLSERNNALQQALVDANQSVNDANVRVRNLTEARLQYKARCEEQDKQISECNKKYNKKLDECNARGQLITSLQNEIARLKDIVRECFESRDNRPIKFSTMEEVACWHNQKSLEDIASNKKANTITNPIPIIDPIASPFIEVSRRESILQPTPPVKSTKWKMALDDPRRKRAYTPRRSRLVCMQEKLDKMKMRLEKNK